VEGGVAHGRRRLGVGMTLLQWGTRESESGDERETERAGAALLGRVGVQYAVLCCFHMHSSNSTSSTTTRAGIYLSSVAPSGRFKTY
jgi:hypothetical protein